MVCDIVLFVSADPNARGRWEPHGGTPPMAGHLGLFGPEQIVENYGEFLGYFMVRKVLAGQELLRAAGTVTQRLAQWLAERGYLTPAQAEVAAARAAEASRDLPRAEQLATLLHEHARGTRLDPTTLAARDYVEDCLEIERVQPGALWFADGIGPVAVPAKASKLAQPGWSVTVGPGAQRRPLATPGSRQRLPVISSSLALWPRQFGPVHRLTNDIAPCNRCR